MNGRYHNLAAAGQEGELACLGLSADSLGKLIRSSGRDIPTVDWRPCVRWSWAEGG